MKLLRVLGAAATFIGALIGAGFASGREIALYFGGTTVLTPLAAGIILGLLCYAFLLLGRVSDGSPDTLLSRSGKPVKAVVRISNAVTFCAMLAGSEEIIFELIGIHGGCVITGIINLIVVLAGVEKIKLCNLIIVPAILVMTIILFFNEHTLPTGGKIVIVPALTYATMNIIGGGYLISSFSAEFSKKECVITACICGGVLTLMLLAVYFTIQNYLDLTMPLIAAAEHIGLGTVGNIVMYLAILTTLSGSLSIASDNKKISACVITACAFVFACFGFRAIVDKCYPLIGIAGSVITALYLYALVKTRRAARLLTDNFNVVHPDQSH